MTAKEVWIDGRTFLPGLHPRHPDSGSPENMSVWMKRTAEVVNVEKLGSVRVVIYRVAEGSP